MSGISFTTYPVQSHQATRTASTSGSDPVASMEKSYLSASTHSASSIAPPASGPHGPGPGLTTLALGEEDGGASMMPESGSMSMPPANGEYQVTTLAIGEESGSEYGGMSPIRDDHGAIGSEYGNDRMHGISDGYGEMQPIYSPGEPEYPAFAKTSETTDLLNFNPVARVPRTVIPQSAPTALPPVSVAAPVVDHPVTMDPVQVGSYQPPLQQSAEYQTVGSYDDYISGVSEETPATAYQDAPAEPAQPLYDTYQPIADSSQYDTMRAPAQPVPAYEEVRPVEPTPSAEYVAAPAASETAPTYSAEPQHKPELFQKDTPFDHTGATDPADPADGNPDYGAPTEATGRSTPTPEVAAPDANSSYIEVPIDAYLVEPAMAGNAPAVQDDLPSHAMTGDDPAKTAAPVASTQPGAETNDASGQDSAPGTMSLGGSYTVMDSALPSAITGASSGTGAAGPATSQGPAPDSSSNELQIMTLAVGEESGMP